MASETFTREGVTYEVEHTDAYVGALGTKWTRRGANKLAERANAERRAPSVRYEVRHVGFMRWEVYGLQNRLHPPGSVRDAGILPRSVLDPAEDVINADLGLPRAWRCRCGGRPFEGKACPRCGATES